MTPMTFNHQDPAIPDIDFKKLVEQHFDVSITYDSYTDGDIIYESYSTIDGYDVAIRQLGIKRTDGFEIAYYPDAFKHHIIDDIRSGSAVIYIELYIAEECGFEPDGPQWEELYRNSIM